MYRGADGPKDGPKAVKLEIVFFHGLHFGSTAEKAYLTTWTNDDKVLWPKTWLADEFPQARILSVSYDASMKQTATVGRQDLYIIGENLIYNIGEAEVGQSPGSPVFLVGHCLGGLVIKELCVQASRSVDKNEKMKRFLDNLGGVFFYGTPHRGTNLFFDEKFLSKLPNGPLLECVKILNERAARLDQVFLDVCHDRDTRPVPMASVGESHKTKIPVSHSMMFMQSEQVQHAKFRFQSTQGLSIGLKGVVDAVIVPEGAVRHESYLYTIDADHISICKPTSKTCNRFKILSTFIRGIKPEKQVQTYRDDFQLLTPKKSVGLDVKVKAVRDLLEKKKIVGIVGMGGIGKTTLAKAAFNEFCQLFDFTCFVEDVKLISGGIQALKNEVSQLICHNGKYIKGSGIEWKGKRLLLVLDDIGDNAEVLSTMIYEAGPGSWFLVTCRDRCLLKEVEGITTYEMPWLPSSDAEKLFLSYAFADRETIPKHLDTLVEKMVNKCDGLPLTLEVIGKCLLKNKEKQFWVQLYDALEEADRFSLKTWETLWLKLRLSFDNLNYEERQMFLDATTFFSNSEGMSHNKDGLFYPGNGWRWTLSDAKAAWGVAYGNEQIRWKSLVDASLVYDVKDEEYIRVHEQLKSLGRKIAEEDKCKGVWNPCKGQELLLSDVPSDHQEVHSLRATSSSTGFSSAPESERKREEEIPRQCFFNLKQLKYLESDYPPHDTTLRIGAAESPEKLSVDLIVLRSPTLSFGQAPIDFTHRRNPQMAVLKLTDHCETFLPESLVTLSSLKIFVLWAERLQELPYSFGELRALEWFHVQHCRALSTLPASFGNLRALKELSIMRCYVLDSLSDDFGNLSALEKLYIGACHALSTLPATFGNLPALKKLDIYLCNVFDSLSDDFGNLSALEDLTITCCNALSTLPASFGNLRALKELSIVWCKNFNSLSDDFGSLSRLEKLGIHKCHALSTIPTSFGNLRRLKVLNIEECEILDCLSEDFGNLTALEKLGITECPGLSTLPASFGNLRALEELVILDCPVLITLPNGFGDLRALKKLIIVGCNVLGSLYDGFGNLSALEELKIRSCNSLSTLPASFGNLSALEELKICWCKSLSTLPASFGNLRALKELRIEGCHVLGSLSDGFGNLSALETLKIWTCNSLSTLPASFGNLRALKKLSIAGCHVLGTLPASFGNLRALKKLSIAGCHVLGSLSDGFENLLALEELHIFGCPVLTTWRYNFGNLRVLKIP